MYTSWVYFIFNIYEKGRKPEKQRTILTLKLK